MSFIEPSFEVDKKGRVICLAHSNYPFFAMPDKTPAQERQMEKILTCKTCQHYFNDECFFPKSEIDRIVSDQIDKMAFTCKLCGNKIDRMLAIIQKLYYKNRRGIEIPLICCLCHETLKKKNFIDFYERRLFLAIFLNITIVFGFFISLFLMPAPYNIINAIIFPLSIIILKQLLKKGFQLNLSYFDIKEGKKYYDKFFKN
jgi:hypothetical protein